ncbi:hypothetical protein ACTFIY_006596 [Dictyostelium cf. discoideum]
MQNIALTDDLIEDPTHNITAADKILQNPQLLDYSASLSLLNELEEAIDPTTRPLNKKLPTGGKSKSDKHPTKKKPMNLITIHSNNPLTPTTHHPITMPLPQTQHHPIYIKQPLPNISTHKIHIPPRNRHEHRIYRTPVIYQ